MWDPASSTFDMTWTGRDGVVGPTELAVPTFRYEEGIEVVVDGEVLSDDAVDVGFHAMDEILVGCRGGLTI